MLIAAKFEMHANSFGKRSSYGVRTTSFQGGWALSNTRLMCSDKSMLNCLQLPLNFPTKNDTLKLQYSIINQK